MKQNKTKIFNFFMIAIFCAILGACANYKDMIDSYKKLITVNEKPQPKQQDKQTLNRPIKTPKNVELFNLEAPIRCNVSWEEDELISAIPFNQKAFSIDRYNAGDEIPRYEVTGFSFEKKSIDKILATLLEEAEIKIIPTDGPYAVLTAKGLKGELKKIVDMITKAGEVFYQYNEKRKVLILKRKVEWVISAPRSKAVMLSILDALRGSAVRYLTVDWEDYTISFMGDAKQYQKVKKLISYFDKEPILLAYDVNVFRTYPYNGRDGVKWQNLIGFFGPEKIKITKRGVLGKMLVTGSEINKSSIISFLRTQGYTSVISKGKIVMANNWQSRFDVGKCSLNNLPESDLSVLLKSKLKDNNRLETKVTLDTTQGEITSFSTKNRFGENYLIVGIPTNAFEKSNKKYSENVVLLTPRVIKVMKKTKDFNPYIYGKVKKKNLSDKLKDLLR